MQCKLPNVPCRSWETSQRTLNYCVEYLEMETLIPPLRIRRQDLDPEQKEDSLTIWNREWDYLRNNSKFADLFPKIDREHSGVYIALENRCSRRDERFFYKLRSNTWTRLYVEVPCKCGYAVESVWHILFECVLIQTRTINSLADLDFSYGHGCEAQRILEAYESFD